MTSALNKYRIIDSSGTESEVVSPDLSEVEGSRAVSILVSVPSKNHVIQVIHPNGQESQADTCPCEA